MSKLTHADLPIVVDLGNGSAALVNRIDAEDIGYDLGTGTTPGDFAPTLTAQGVPPYPSFDYDAPATWPTAAELAAHVASYQPTAASTLAAAKAARIEQAKAARFALVADGFTYGGKSIQTRNQVDIDNINSATLAARANPAFATDWICTDNTTLALDQAGMIALQTAMVVRGNAIFAAYIVHRAALEAAADIAALEAIPSFTA